MKFSAILPAIFVLSWNCMAQETLLLATSDGLTVRASLYLQDKSYPFLLLFHDKESTSEFSILSSRLLNMNYNCLSVTLRDNALQTASLDIDAAIEYSKHINSRPVILAGSSRCASICLLSAINNADVEAVIAMSPGEYFVPAVKLSEKIKSIGQPVFVTTTNKEYPYIQKMFLGADPQKVTLFRTEKNLAFHGASVFNESNPSNKEYWFALMMFFKKLGQPE